MYIYLLYGAKMKKIVSIFFKITLIILFFNWSLFADDEKEKTEKKAVKVKAEKEICPDGMVHIPRGLVKTKKSEEQKGNTLTFLEEFCIDQYEYPNKKGESPSINITWYEAEEYCKKEDKRLCSGEEWEKACAGKEWLKYSYGNTFIPERCGQGGEPKTVLDNSGTFPQCKSEYGVYDMIGGAWEWTSDPSNTTYVKRGGYINAVADEANCFSRAPQPPKSAGIHDGFRCCKDVSPNTKDK
jgi:eukaryotic-like serine/threonine-protein kinase